MPHFKYVYDTLVFSGLLEERLVNEALVTNNRTPILKLPGAIPIEGGLPIIVSDKAIGAIGVSGVTAQQDGQIAKAGADALPKILEQ